MHNVITFIKTIIVSIVGYISIKLGILAPLLVFLVIAITMDYISGMIAASVNGELNSKRGMIGILKKLGYIFAVIVALIADQLIIVISSQFGVEVAAIAAFGILTTIWLTLNELLSIIENLSRIGVPLPKFLKKIISQLKDTVDKKGE